MRESNWYFSDFEGSGRENMGYDVSLLESSLAIPVLRIYRFTPPCITEGYHQKPFVSGMSEIEVVKRITGGRAVFHHGDLTYSVAAPVDYFETGIYASYRQIADPLIRALSKFSDTIECRSRPDDLKSSNPLCFGSVSYYEIEASGKKLVGSAQRRIKGRFLQHGSIMLNVDYALHAAVFSENEDVIRTSMIGLNEVSHCHVSYEDVKQALKESFAEAFEVSFIDLPDTHYNAVTGFKLSTQKL